VLYGITETLFGNWSSLYLSGQRGLGVATASAALAAFWACVTVGRVIVAVLPARIPATAVYLLLPVLIVGANVAVSGASTAATAVLAYAAAGLACSAMLPLSISFAGREFPRLGATSASELIAGYQIGYGVVRGLRGRGRGRRRPGGRRRRHHPERAATRPFGARYSPCHHRHPF
jgi:fucose permease